MRAPLRFQELQREVEEWCHTHGARCETKSTIDNDEIPAFVAVLEADGRRLYFRLVKAWPPIIEVRRDDYPDDDRALRLLKVDNQNHWHPSLHELLDPWVSGHGFDEPPPPLRFQELRREVEQWCGEHKGECTADFDHDPARPAFAVALPEGRRLQFTMLKAWPPIVEVVDPNSAAEKQLLKVTPANEWTPPLHQVLDQWVTGKPAAGH
jgi:hypothetical protein